MRTALLAAALLGLAAGARGEDDAVSVEERRTQDEEDPLLFRSGFSGDTRFRAREIRPPGSTYLAAPPELQHNVYLYQRTRLSWAGVSGGFLVKRAAVGPALSYDNLHEFGTLKASIALEKIGPLVRAVAGNYTMAFGQGLLFYDAFGEFVRPVKVADQGPKSDWSTSPSDGLRGGAVRLAAGAWGLDLFASQKTLDAALNPDGSVDADLDGLRDETGDVQDGTDLARNNALTERLAGARLARRVGDGRLGLSGYQSRYSRAFAPADQDFADARNFRGDRISLWGADFDWPAGEWFFFGEAAGSRSGGPGGGMTGKAWTAAALRRRGRARWWLALFQYDPDFISPHGKGTSFAVSGTPESLPRNQEGATWGGEFVVGPWRSRLNATWARFPEALGNGATTAPVQPSQGLYLLADQRWNFGTGLEGRLYITEKSDERRLADPNTGLVRQVEQKVARARLGFHWRADAHWAWEVRHDLRWERVPAFHATAKGRLWMAEGTWSGRSTAIKARTYFFHSPDAYLTTGPEEIWDGVAYPRQAGNAGSLRGVPGTRTYLILRQKLSDHGRLWVKAEITRRPQAAEDRTAPAVARHGWHVQWEEEWGGK